ncbi:MAG: hypothetical protein AAF483_09240 [Planctomycetota bacterium]
MEDLFEFCVFGSDFFVPIAAIWAVASLYTLKSGCRCKITECGFFAALLLVAICTVRTVLANEACWLVHTATLGLLIVAGVMRRPAETIDLADF